MGAAGGRALCPPQMRAGHLGIPQRAGALGTRQREAPPGESEAGSRHQAEGRPGREGDLQARSQRVRLPGGLHLGRPMKGLEASKAARSPTRHPAGFLQISGA